MSMIYVYIFTGARCEQMDVKYNNGILMTNMLSRLMSGATFIEMD